MTDAERHQECMEIACEALERFACSPGEAGRNARTALLQLHQTMDPAAAKRIDEMERLRDEIAELKGQLTTT